MVLVLYMQPFSPPVRAVLLTAAALDLDLEKRVVDLSKKENLTESYLKMNPQHTIPTLEDNGTIIWDSHAIMAYLVDKYGKNDTFYPKDLAKRALVDQRLHFDSGCIFNWIRHIARGMKYKGRRGLTQDQIEALEESYRHLETFLTDRKWVAGDNVTIADFSLIADVSSLDMILHPVDSDKYPNVRRWLKNAEQLPYYHANLPGLEDYRAMFKPFM